MVRYATACGRLGGRLASKESGKGQSLTQDDSVEFRDAWVTLIAVACNDTRIIGRVRCRSRCRRLPCTHKVSALGFRMRVQEVGFQKGTGGC
jgi:hypothetical protein